jgi:hypothetical protein
MRNYKNKLLTIKKNIMVSETLILGLAGATINLIGLKNNAKQIARGYKETKSNVKQWKASRNNGKKK